MTRRTYRRLAISAAAVVAVVCCAASADEVHMTDGRVLVGEAEEAGDTVVVRMRLGTIEVARRDVLRIDRKPTPEQEYKTRKAATADGDLDARRALGHWCADNGLRDEALVELLAVAAARPDDAETGKLLERLGYERLDGKWVSQEEALAAKGFVKAGGKWVPKAEAERAEAEKRARELLWDWRRARPEKRPELAAQFEAIDAAIRLPVLNEALSSTSPDVRRYALKQVDALHDGSSVDDVVRMCIDDKEEELRDEAFFVVRDHFPSSSISRLARYAAQKEFGVHRVRALQALGELGGDGAVKVLLQVTYSILVEVRATNARLVPGPPAVQSHTTGIGGGTSATIETPELKVERIRTTVRIPDADSPHDQFQVAAWALEKATGQTFGTDYDAWVNWYSKSRNGGGK